MTAVVSVLLELVRVLGRHPEVASMRTISPRCEDRDLSGAVVILDRPALTCVSMPLEAPYRCRERRDEDVRERADAFCKLESNVATPAWLSDLAMGEDLAILPSESGPPAILVNSVAYVREFNYLLVRGASGWRPPDGPLVEGSARRLRTIDTTPLTKQPSVGALVETYDGGSESGAFLTQLVIATDGGENFIEHGRLNVGYFHWFVAAAERSRCRGCAGSYDARPHVELQLEPTLVGDELRLARKVKNLKRLSRVCERGEIKSGHADDDSICPIEDLQKVGHDAGTWRYRDGRLVR